MTEALAFGRVVRLARLPEMRLAYFEVTATPGDDEAEVHFPNAWDAFNEWRVRTRPALGRIDIAALGWELALTPAQRSVLTYRTAVPIRSDYKAEPPALTTFFPGGAFAYCYADNWDEITEAFAAVEAFLPAEGLVARSGGIEAYKFHYNMEQHPCDCGFLVARADGGDPLPPVSSHANPLPIARD